LVSKKVLIVEDEAIIAANLRRLLVGFGYETPPFIASGEDAVGNILAIRPDVILMDIKLAGPMSGVQAANDIHAQLDIPIIFMTAYADDERLQAAMSTEPYGYLVKPVQEPELRAAIQMALYKHGLDQKLRQSEARSRLNAERMATLVKIYQMQDALWTDLADFALKETVRLTSSTQGYLIYTINEIHLQSTSWPPPDHKTDPYDPSALDTEQSIGIDIPTFYQLGQQLLPSQAIVINNDLEHFLPIKSLLPSHQHLRHAALVPVFNNDRVAMIAIVGNKPGNYDDDDLAHLTLTFHTVWSIFQRARMVEELQLSHLEMTAAYEGTIEGWARALEQRDQETRGHSDRVMELTLRLADYMGFPEEQWVDLRRGVRLHDIGKMGVPDHILLKDGPLTDEEWAIMRLHPVYAYQLLSLVPYLHTALDVPYCHHEKWDGSGYPRGLKGEQIPLMARIFAVVDVWDAMTSDRPYRAAMPQSAALDYIRQQAGKHFDPAVAQAFLKMVSSSSADQIG
jgi:response regulator RpfG family c-di-GMP phosphodiesterase